YVVYASFMFSLSSYFDYRDLLSFPTRRSSDLGAPSSPPARPAGAILRRSLIKLKVTGSRASISRISPSPPRWAPRPPEPRRNDRSEEHTSELQSRENLVCRLLLEKKKTN